MSLTDLFELFLMLAAAGSVLRLAGGTWTLLASWKGPATACATGGAAGAWLCAIALSDAARTGTFVLALMLFLLLAHGGSDDGY